MNLKNLSNSALLSHTKAAVQREKESTIIVLRYLREVEARRLYGAHSSLFEFCCRELGYSESAANRRIKGARLIAEIPEMEEKIESGVLSLTTVVQAQTFFHQTPLARGEKKELLEKLEQKSTREVEKILVALNPEAIKPDRLRVVTPTEIELRVTLDDALAQDLEKIKGLLAHQLPKDASYRELLKKMAELVLAKVDPSRQKNAAPIQAAPAVDVPAANRRFVWRRDEGRCTHQENQQRCQSQHGLQIDHILPRSRGGTHAPENLRLLCWHHHQKVTEEMFAVG